MKLYISSFILFLMLFIGGCQVDSTSVDISTDKEMQKRNSQLTVELQGKIIFDDGTEFESWDKKREFIIPEKYSSKLLQKISEELPNELPTITYNYTIYSQSNSIITIYGTATFSQITGYANSYEERYLYSPRIQGIVQTKRATIGSTFSYGIQSTVDGINYNSDSNNLIVNSLIDEFPLNYGPLYWYYPTWWDGGIFDSITISVTINAPTNGYVEIRKILYSLQSTSLY